MARRKIEITKNLILALQNIEELNFEEFKKLTGLSYPMWRKLFTGIAGERWMKAIEISKNNNFSMNEKMSKIKKLFEPAPKVTKKIEAGRGRRKQWLDAATAFLTLKQLEKGKSFKEICQDLDLDIHWKTLESAIIERRYDKSEVELYFKGIKTISLNEQRRINALIAELEKLTGKKVVLVEK